MIKYNYNSDITAINDPIDLGQPAKKFEPRFQWDNLQKLIQQDISDDFQLQTNNASRFSLSAKNTVTKIVDFYKDFYPAIIAVLIAAVTAVIFLGQTPFSS